MEKERTAWFDSMYSGISDEQIDAITEKVKGRRKIYIIAWIVCGVLTSVVSVFVPQAIMLASLLMGIFCGLTVYCHNTICVLESRGKKKSGGLVSLLICFLGALIIPVVILIAIGKFPKIGTMVIGC